MTVVALRQISTAPSGGTGNGVASNVERATAAAHCAVAAVIPGSLGHSKLNVALWYADVEHYRRVGASLTGLMDYTRTPQGPFSKQISRAVTLLVKQGMIEERLVENDKFARRGMFNMRDYMSAALSQAGIAIVQRSTEAVARLTAKQLSDLVASDALWQETAPGQSMLIATGSIITRSSPAISSGEKEQASYRTNPRPVPFRQNPPSGQPEPS